MAQKLSIVKNGKDISGKGIRDTEALLSEYLPDINMQMLSNIVVLGQGLPFRFSNNTPSGRKEVLEKLFKADFMIEDIKTRINDRLTDLKNEQRQYEDDILALSTKVSVFTDGIETAQRELDTMKDVSELKALIGDGETAISQMEAELGRIRVENENILKENDTINRQILDLTQSKVDINNSEYLIKEINEIKDEGISLKSEVVALDKEIEKKDNITDICPTCGQKLIGVEKPDTTEEKAQSMKIKAELDALRTQLKELQERRQQELNSKIAEVENKINQLKSGLKSVTDISSIEKNIKSKQSEVDFYKGDLIIFNNKKEELKNSITNNTKSKEEAEKKISDLETEKIKLDSRIDIDNKINSIIKRDFRGYLLSNIISLLDNTTKQHALTLFGHTNVNIKQDGNNISITLNDKEYELLSSGEKQKVDILIQISMREVLCKYLNFNSNIIVCDELFDALDYGSVEKVINILTNGVNVPSMFIVTHRQDIEIPVDSKIIVKKNDAGSIALQI